MNILELFEEEGIRPLSELNKTEESNMKIQELTESKQALTEAKIVEGSLNLIGSVIVMLEDVDWEPQPKFRGVKGKTTATGAGERLGRVNQAAKAGEKTQQVWMKMVRQLPKLDPQSQRKLIPELTRMAQAAQAKGVQLSPDPKSLSWFKDTSSQEFA